MTDEQMRDTVQTLVNDERLNAFTEVYLSHAKAAIIDRLYPHKANATWEDVPERFHYKAVEIAVYLVNRRGSEGETSHQESGTSRSYESAGIPSSYFFGMSPFVGLPE